MIRMAAHPAGATSERNWPVRTVQAPTMRPAEVITMALARAGATPPITRLPATT